MTSPVLSGSLPVIPDLIGDLLSDSLPVIPDSLPVIPGLTGDLLSGSLPVIPGSLLVIPDLIGDLLHDIVSTQKVTGSLKPSSTNPSCSYTLPSDHSRSA